MIPIPSATSFITRMRQLLVETTNLLAFIIDDPYGELTPSAFPTHVPLFSLQLVEFTCHDASASGLWEFVTSQRKIRRLVFPRKSTHRASIRAFLFLEALPELEAVAAEAHLLLDLIQGRPVISIQVKSTRGPPELDVLFGAITASSCVVTALSVEVDSDESLAMFIQGLLLHARPLHYLCITLNPRRGGSTPEAIAFPLKELVDFQCLRWRGATIRSGSVCLVSSRWHPAAYAGPSLRFVQHEVKFYGTPSLPLWDFEGIWERHDVDVNNWKTRPCYHIAPRRPNSYDPVRPVIVSRRKLS